MIRRFTTFFLIICFVLLIGSSIVFADDPTVIAAGECGTNATWSLDSNGVLTISGSGEMEDYGSNQQTPWNSYKTRITSVVVEDGVTSVGDSAFGDINTLTKVQLSNSVTRIGEEAFLYCRNLSDFTCSSSLTSLGMNAFAYCAFTSIELPDTLTVIPMSAFINSGIQTITIPSSITQIGEDAFKRSSLTTVYYSGTQDGWNAISIDPGNEKLTSATIQFMSETQYAVVYKDHEMIFQATTDPVEGKERDRFYSINYAGSTPPWSEVASTVTKVTFMTPVKPSTMAHWFDGFDDLRTINGLDIVNTSSVTDMSWLFFNCDSLYSLDVSSFDTGNVTNMSNMFNGCSGLTSLDVSSFDTGNVTNMAGMFSGCHFSSLDLSGFETSHVTNMSSMFLNCGTLTDLNIAGFKTDRAINMSSMFYGCASLSSLNVSKFNTRNVTNMGNMFYDCAALSTLDLSSFNTSSVTDSHSMFGLCSTLGTVYVSDSFALDENCYSTQMFYSCSNLTGGNGTDYDAEHIDGEYARIDTAETPGYFTRKAYVKYAVIYKDGEMIFQATSDPVEGKEIDVVCDAGYSGSVPPWNYKNDVIKKVTFAAFFAPTSTRKWFEGCSILQTIDGIDKLDTSKVVNMSSMFSGCSALTKLDVSGFNTGKVIDMSFMFRNCSGLTSLDVSHFNTSCVDEMYSMFDGCSSLTTLDVSGFDMHNVVETNYMFRGCSALKEINVSRFDTSGAWDMSYMFADCSSLTALDLSSFNTSKVQDMKGLFSGCSLLTTIYAGDNFSVCSSSSNMFDSCTSLVGGSGTPFNAEHIDGTYAHIDTPDNPGYFTRKVGSYAVVYDDDEMIFQATTDPVIDKPITATYSLNYSGTTPPWYDDQGNSITKVSFADPVAPTSTRQWFSCFTHLKTIEGIKKLDTSAVTDMSCMFESCYELETLDLSGFNTSNVTNMWCMFGGLYSLETLDLSGFDTSSVTDMSEMFTESSFTTLDLSGFDTSNVTNMENMFYCCSSLDTIYAGTGFVACSNSQNMFINCPNLVGETGTPYNSNYVDGTYARIGTFEYPGYFTDKTTNKARFVIVYNNGEMIFQATRKPLEGKTIKAVYALGKYIFTDTLMYPAWVVEEASNVTSITFADVVTPVKTWWWFKDFSNVRSIQGLDKLDTSNVTNMVEMFYNCSALESLDLSNFDTSNVEGIDRLFYGCSALTELDLESFNTKKTTSMYQMFANCSALTTIYASEDFVVDVIRDIDDDMMFSGCTSLVGGNETRYDANYVDGTYARIDKPGEPGYFTHKTHADDLVLTEAKDATCETPGNSEYYTCSVCDKYFSDAEGTNEIEVNSWVIPAAGHTLTAYDEVPAGCTTIGTAQYWTCDNCSKMFSDTSAENEIAAPIVVPALGHNLTAHAGVPAGCETVGNSPYWSCSRNGCGKYFSDAAGTQEIDENSWVLAATGHDWSDITYTWAEDNSTVTGLKACNNDHGHDISEIVNTAYTVKTEPSCATAGTGKYTANFSNEIFAAQIKEVEIPTIAHTPCEPIKEIIIDAACVTAGSYDSVVKCAVCGAEISREAIVVPALGHDLTAHEAVSASCETAGNSAYWICGNCGKIFSDAAGTQEITENSWVIPAKGHSWGVITYTWANDNSTVTASKPCANDHAHDITETVKATFATVTPAQCGSSGEGIYVADFTNELFSTQTKKVVIPAIGHTLSKTEAVPAGCETAGSSAYWTCSKCGKYFSDAGGMNEIEAGDWAVPAKGHAWAEITYTWAEDNSKVMALRACANDHAHDVTETADATFATITQATCETAGRGVCFAAFKNSLFVTQTKEVEIPATGHSYKLTSWTWADDFSKATALFTCEHDASHTEEVTATMKAGEIATDDSIVAQKFKDVEKPYTATVTGPDGEFYENTVTEILKATHKVHKHKSSDDGKSFDADVRIDSLTVEITGDGITEAAPLLVASYDKDGRFLGLAVVKKAAESPVEIAEDAESVKIFWVNAADDTPRCEDEEIDRKAE